MEYILSMTFLTEHGLKSTISISGVKAAITKDEISSLMDTIITNNIFLSKSGALVSKEDAKVTERKVTKYDLA